VTLIDTSVWVDHMRRPDGRVEQLLTYRRALVHPFTIGELASGNLRKRTVVLACLDELPHGRVAEDREVRAMLESHRLWGMGLGWVDLHLIASAMISGSNVLTHDHAMLTAAKKLRVAYPVN
jgi:predicted nucleic acid-binding protein